MSKKLFRAAVAVVCVVSALLVPAAHSEAKEPSGSVTIEVVGAVILPAKIDGRPWDGLSEKQTQIAVAFGKVFAQAAASAVPGGVAYASAVNLIESPEGFAIQGPPDTEGTTYLRVDGRWDNPLALAKRQGELLPQWSGVAYKAVWSDELALKVVLVDRDVANDDTIGTVVLNAEDLTEAHANGKVFPIDVHEQGTKQVLFILVIVKDA